MAHSGNRITAPVRITQDLCPVLGTSRTGLGSIIVNAAINKWAKNKPVRLNKITAITASELSSVHYGLQPLEVIKIVRTSLGYTGSGSDSEVDCLAEIADWTYNRPRGGSYSEWFRTLDFNGYNHDAVPSDGAWGNYGFTDTQIATFKGASVTATGSRADKNLAFSPNTNIGIYSNFSMQITDSSQGRWNWQQNMEIPIAGIDGGISQNNDWRLVMAVWLPTQSKWALFPARKNFYAILQESNLQNFFPDFGTNPYAWSLLQAEIGTATKKYDCVPLIMQNIDFTNINGLFCPRAVADATRAYCMPSGAKTLEISTSPSFIVYLSLTATTDSGAGTITYTLHNSDTANAHKAGCRLVIRVNGQITQDTRQEYNVYAGGNVTVGPMPYNQTTTATLTLETQDGTPIP